jgi:hypothetical protein
MRQKTGKKAPPGKSGDKGNKKSSFPQFWGYGNRGSLIKRVIALIFPISPIPLICYFPREQNLARPIHQISPKKENKNS